MHIEQGVVLESEGVDLGVVTSIVGIRRIEIDSMARPTTLARLPWVSAATPSSPPRVQWIGSGALPKRSPPKAGITSWRRSASSSFALGLQCGARPLPAHRRRTLDLTEMTKRFAERIDRESEDHAGDARVKRTGFSVLPTPRRRPAIRAARRNRSRRAAARFDHSGARKRRRTRCGLHDSHLPRGHDLHAVPRGQKPRARGMGGSAALAAGASVMFETVRALDRAG